MVTPTIPHELEQRARDSVSTTAYRDRSSGEWVTTTWGELYDLTRQAGRSLLALGVGTGDAVAIIGSNRPEWTIGALATMCVGGVAAGMYATNSPEEIAHIVNHAESKIVVAENEDQLAKIQQIWAQLPALEHVVLMDGDSPDDRVLGWASFLDRGTEVDESKLDECLQSLEADQLADLIYTSGTTGPPKAVMLTHENLHWTARMLGDAAGFGHSSSTVSYLPLSHIAEQMSTIHIAVVHGYTVSYCPDGTKLNEYMLEVQPTHFFGVPRVWERMQSAVAAEFAEAKGAKAVITAWARRVGTSTTAARNDGRDLPLRLRLQSGVAQRLVFSKVRAALGMQRSVRLIAGAAPTSLETLEFFGSLGMAIEEIYGQSEDAGPTSSNLPGATKFGSVGRALPGVEVRLSGEGEVLVRGPNVFAGYYKEPEATAETLVDGWLHSGDLGSLDADGFLTITGRSKDIIITSGGKNVAPRNIEAALESIDLVSNAVCVGDRRRHLIALLTIGEQACARFAADHNLGTAEVHASEELQARLRIDIAETVNSRFARVEHIRNFVILPHEFGLATGELTPTMKLKRAVVNQMYESQIDAAYAKGEVL